jgi:hypothetical protein
LLRRASPFILGLTTTRLQRKGEISMFLQSVHPNRPVHVHSLAQNGTSHFLVTTTTPVFPFSLSLSLYFIYSRLWACFHKSFHLSFPATCHMRLLLPCFAPLLAFLHAINCVIFQNCFGGGGILCVICNAGRVHNRSRRRVFGPLNTELPLDCLIILLD